MKHLAPVVVLFVAALAVAACGGSNKEAAEPAPTDPAAKPAETAEPAGPPDTAAAKTGEVDPEWKRMGDMAADLLRKLHAVATTNADNCDAMADGLVAMAAENKTFIEETKNYQGNAEFNQWFAETYQAELQKLMSEMQPALIGCKDNKKVIEAFKTFES